MSALTVSPRTLRARLAPVGLAIAMLVIVSWPLVLPELGLSVTQAVVVALLAMPLALAGAVWWAQSALISVRLVALVGVLAALTALARVTSVGLGGFEWVFIVVILAGRALGPAAGFVVGAVGIAVSSLVFGGVGPWTAFQMAAVGAVAAGAGLLPRWNRSIGDTSASGPVTRGEMGLLAGYGVLSAYLFGLVMNLWFWPIAVGPDTSISFDEAGTFAENLTRFVVFSLTTSTLTWDTVRAIVTAVGIVLLARPLLGAIRRVYHPWT
jgi:hypothetical protein